MTRNERLNALFAEWEATLTPSERALFVRDGIVHEPTYDCQPRRLLFILAEANATFRPVDECGRDLRVLYQRDTSGKTFNRRLSAWTEFLLDDKDHPSPRTPNKPWPHLCRVATMNLKKTGGGGSVEQIVVQQHALRDREFILEQIRIISPNLLIACGGHVRSVLLRVLRGLPSPEALGNAPCDFNGIRILSSKHPACRNSGESVNEPLYSAFHSLH